MKKAYPTDAVITAAWAVEIDGRVTLYVPAGLTAAEEAAAIRRISARLDDTPEEDPEFRQLTLPE
jgi:hypothetical protein